LYSGNANSEMPEDSKNAVLHWGDVLAANQECPANVTVTPLPDIREGRSTMYEKPAMSEESMQDVTSVE